MKTEKDPEQADDKRVYRRPQLSVLGPITRTTLSNVKGLVLDNPPSRFNAYSGYAGWATGQLERELQRGDRLLVEADTSTVFDQPAGHIWRELYQSRRFQQWVMRNPEL